MATTPPASSASSAASSASASPGHASALIADVTEVVAVATTPPASDLASKIQALRKQQQEYIAERKRIARELRNAERKRRRLKERAKALSNSDLAEVIALRALAAAEPKTAATAKARSEPDATPEVKDQSVSHPSGSSAGAS